MPVVQAAIVYQDDFSGAAGSAASSVPEITVSDWAGATANAMELDGAGKLESSDAGNAAANYRFRIATDPLTTHPTNEMITLSATIRTPASEWMAIGFHENNVNGLIGASGNSGPYLRFHGNSTWVSPGTGLENQVQLVSTHTAGDVMSIVMEYHVLDKTLDIWLDGIRVARNQSQLTSLVDWPERLLTLERFVESLGLNFTLIANTGAATTGQEFQEGVVEYVQAYRQVGGTPHAYMVQSWYPVPTLTLPETNAYTMANTVLEAKKNF